ncbi:MFS transporter [Streptomyces sp. NBC_01451]|uniref:MFS transporter n=1 Tax=Streptomyces sp. NBC_01451 TaxID=2903872 RepID=UPI002E2FCE62|nr:MFS transporter [Streptomyces sp. NBC_01451]
MSRRAFTAWLSADHMAGNLGQYMILPLLGVFLTAQVGGTWIVGVGLFLYSASAGVSALLVNRWLPRFTIVGVMTGSTVLSALGFGLMPYSRSGAVQVLLIVLAGFGGSVHFLLSRVLVAEVVPDAVGRHKVYSALQIAVNTAAALGPFLAGLLYSTADPRLLLSSVAGCYLLAGLSLRFGIPKGLKPTATSSRWPVSRAVLRLVRADPWIRRTVAICLLGAFVYGQLYSAFALFVARDIDSALVRAALLGAPALAIVFLQSAVTAATGGLLAKGRHPFTMLVYGAVLFSASMVVLGVGLPVVAGAAVAVALFSGAEMLFTPMVSTAFAGLPVKSTLEAFNLRQISWTAGEAIGSLAGGTVFLALDRAGLAHGYWLGVALGTGALCYLLGRRLPQPGTTIGVTQESAA